MYHVNVQCTYMYKVHVQYTYMYVGAGQGAPAVLTHERMSVVIKDQCIVAHTGCLKKNLVLAFQCADMLRYVLVVQFYFSKCFMKQHIMPELSGHIINSHIMSYGPH